MGFLRGGVCEILPKVGAYVQPDNWPMGEFLQESDWDQAEFRIPGNGYLLAANVKVTGRTLQQPFGRYAGAGSWIRVKVTFVADKCQDWYTGETVGEDTVVRGWMEVSSAKIVNHD